MRSMLVLFGLVAVCLNGCGGGGGGGGNDGVISFLGGPFTVNEDGTPLAPITVQRAGGSGAVSVTLSLSDGTATGGTPLMPPFDYDDSPIVISWAAGDLADKVVNVAVLNDTNDEPDETVNLSLVNPTGGAVLGTPATSTLTIIDDDVAGAVQFSTAAYSYNESGTPVAMAVTVQRVGGIDGAVSATIVSTDGTANSDPLSQVEPVDYTPVNTTVTFPDQNATDIVVDISLNILQDVLPELDEFFTLSLTNPTNGVLLGTPSSATVTIVDDDPLLVITESPPTLFGRFGSSVAKVGASLAIGSPGSDPPAGRVYIVNPAIPVVNATLDGGPFAERYGSSLAVDGATFAIGGLGNVFVRDTFTLDDRFTLSSAQNGFGEAMIGLGDGRLVIGAPGAQLGSIDPAGQVFVYDDLTGILQQTIDGVGDSRLGAAFALFGTQLLVGAPGDTGGVLRYASSPLALNFFIGDTTVEPPSSAFGAAIASIGNTILIGEPDSDFFGTMNGGTVQLFDGTTGTMVTSIFGALVDARFGNRITVLGDNYAVQHQGTGAGGSVVFISSVGGILITVANPVPNPGAKFGESMCEFDGVLVVGAPEQDLGGGFTDAGTVFIIKGP